MLNAVFFPFSEIYINHVKSSEKYDMKIQHYHDAYEIYLQADSNVVAAYLKKEDVTELNYVVCSHAHEDHVGGLSGALSVTKADNIYAPKTETNTKAYKNFKKKAEEQNVEIKHPNVGDEIQLGSSTVEFLGPVDENGKDLNSTSIVLKITYGYDVDVLEP